MEEEIINKLEEELSDGLNEGWENTEVGCLD